LTVFRWKILGNQLGKLGSVTGFSAGAQ